ncbi:polysaccharide biosynthesis tyrosine autokinase [Mycobacterium deserti]|uniref:AAA family ATPase n=1 Tax=Mycobacterium deserti TaxID=2978347 RepID=A0ABT2MD17_9MYCO|nr:polysaccharide biosynthesis tyrosine autokinase [Mycobacterium deserti]MCT7660164.1 AAA family ATPase [Mycobacterium deserti]
MDLRTFASIIKTRWRIVIAAIVACLVGAVAVTVLQTKTYEASAKVLVSFPGVTSINDAYAATQAAQQRLSSYAEIAGGRTVAARALDELKAPLTADDLVKSTEVSYTPESMLFRLSVTDSDPQRAAALATAMADQFALLVPQVDAGVADAQPSGPAAGAEDDGGQLAAAQATVVEPPTVPEKPVSPVPARNVVLGLLAGILLGIALALARNATDRTVRSGDAVTASSGLPVLAQLPGPGASAAGAKRAATPAELVVDEGLRGLRTRLLGGSSTPPRSFLISAPGVGQGATTTALNLAQSFAAVDEAVLLIEGDPRRPTIAKLLGLQSPLGLADVLADPQLLDDAVQPTRHAGLWMLAATESSQIKRQANATLLSAALEKLFANFDRVVIDGPPSFISADTGVLSAAVDATVLVVRSGVTTVDEIDGALQNLRAAGGDVVGAVLTDAPVPRRTKDAIVAYREMAGDTASKVSRGSHAKQ